MESSLCPLWSQTRLWEKEATTGSSWDGMTKQTGAQWLSLGFDNELEVGVQTLALHCPVDQLQGTELNVINTKDPCKQEAKSTGVGKHGKVENHHPDLV